MMIANPTTLVIGLGNPILGDDGVGWKVAEVLRQELENPKSSDLDLQSVEVDCLSVGGLSLMERLAGYGHVILIDAIYTGQKPLGSVMTLPLSALPDPAAGHSASAHDTSLQTALSVGRSINIPLPADKDILIVAIETKSEYELSEELTPAVALAVPSAVKTVMSLLQSLQADGNT